MSFEGSESLHHLSSSGLAKTLTHMPTALVEHWFRYICPTRSTFDSETNYNRRLACNTWSTSEAVFYTLQAMSAEYSMPHLSKDLRAQAVAAVDQEMNRIRSVQTTMVTVDLVFAVFKLGTSLSGTPDTGEHSWSDLAHELLTVWGMQMSAADVLLHAYFCQALTYWEMVLAAIGGGSIPRRVDRKRWKYETSARRDMQLLDGDLGTPGPSPLPYDPGLNLLGTRPNSWCGISNEVIDLFGQVLALCRTKVRGNLSSATDALYDTYLAHEFQRELLAMDFDTLVLMDEVNGYFIETRDDKTPISHLLQTAEAYRQAALLQLHLAFNHLSVDTTPRAEFLLRLVLRLLETLEQIPLDSGSRTIHPMLYLSAAAGLRHLEPSASTGVCTLQVGISRAIRLVSTRFESLPSHASGGTLQFVKSVWRQYKSNRSWVYWKDVLEEFGSGLML
ncbi:fungal-specific transcription factor domain-containing protein [Fusarium solani]|jgi:hypothetical protein|uniref:Fungal-specific transcription factor domain-containing protein n=1 Tax=Fusarium solani TaxID=169388 RepID=A0A9P9KTE6_FUSSL|nr:fungal-specific transcription factor domain-containing protein [Fusarium solani]KAH7268184.1 fungal-specific transcription factor domain-containing protein [Fusarium solani]